jgi:uncharacterized protein (DUF433 family)
MSADNKYRHLERRPGSNYKQLIIKGRRIRAEILYHQTVGEDARTPQQVADDYDLPVEAVVEAIDYCRRHPEVLQRDQDRELAKIQEHERLHPPALPSIEQAEL